MVGGVAVDDDGADVASSDEVGESVSGVGDAAVWSGGADYVAAE